MTIKDFLSVANVVTDVRASDKAGLLKELARRAAAALNLSADTVASEMEGRTPIASAQEVRPVVGVLAAALESAKKSQVINL